MNKSIFAVAAALGLSALAGCGPTYDHIDFGQHTSPPLPAVLLPSGVSIPEGIAVGIEPFAISTGGDEMEDYEVALLSSDTGVLGIDRAPEKGFVLFGARPGNATITVFVDGERVDTIPAEVTEQ